MPVLLRGHRGVSGFDLLFLGDNLVAQRFDSAKVGACVGVDLLGGESGFGEKVVHKVGHAA